MTENPHHRHLYKKSQILHDRDSFFSPSTMDSFSEPYTRQGDDISIDQVRENIRLLEDQHRAAGIPLSGRVLHVCHYLPVAATLNAAVGVPSPPPTPPADNADDADTPTKASAATWSIAPRYGHAAMISGIRSLSSSHEQVIVGWTGDILVSYKVYDSNQKVNRFYSHPFQTKISQAILYRSKIE